MFKPVVASILTGCGLVAFYFLELRANQNLEPVKITARMTNDPGPIEHAILQRETRQVPPCPRIRMENMRHDEAAKLFNRCAGNFVHLTFVGRAATDAELRAGFNGEDAEDFATAVTVSHCDYVLTRRGYTVTIAVDPKVRCESLLSDLQ